MAATPMAAVTARAFPFQDSMAFRGGAISTLACFGIITLLDLVIIKLALPRSLSYARVFAKPAAAAAAMGATAWAVNGLTGQLLNEGGSLNPQQAGDLVPLGHQGQILLGDGLGQQDQGEVDDGSAAIFWRKPTRWRRPSTRAPRNI